MQSIREKFSRLGTDNAPGQEVRQQSSGVVPLLRGEALAGRPVDFSHVSTAEQFQATGTE